MDVNSFFDQLEAQYSKNLPFVVYSKPNTAKIASWLQNDDSIQIAENFDDSGFVFAPFDSRKDVVLFSERHCDTSQIEVTETIGVDTLNSEIVCDKDETSKQFHIDMVNRGIAAIEQGRFSKVVLSRVEVSELQSLNPISIFKHLFNTYKTAFVYCWYHPKIGLWLGATPELLLHLQNQQLKTISLAGTQTYNPENQVKWSQKEIEEQQIVTDYITNQLEPHCNTINVSKAETLKAGNLLHLKSEIKSIIKKTSNLKMVVEALHPTPAVCGFPKNEAKDFIFQHENYDREFYTGYLGEVNLKVSKTRNNNRRNVENNAYQAVKTTSELYVNLRCMQLKNSKALLYVGGGITKDSVAEKEWQETVNKTKTLLKVI